MSTTRCSPTDAVSEWTLILCAGIVIASSFFLVAADAFCQSFCGFFDVATVDIFLSVNRNDANAIGKQFSADVLNDWVLHDSSFTQLRIIALFEQNNFIR